MGEGWHNNHHAYQSSVRQGFKWWEIDLTFYVLVALSWVGIVWDLKYPPRAVVRNEHRLGSRIVSRAAAQLAASFHPEGLAIAVGAALDGATLATLREKISATQQRAAIVLANIHLPHLPTRTEVFGRATAMFTKTSSMDEIVDRAHMLILDTIGAQLWVKRYSGSATGDPFGIQNAIAVSPATGRYSSPGQTRGATPPSLTAADCAAARERRPPR